MKLWKKCLLALIVILCALILTLLMQVRSMEVETLSDDLHVIRGMGGNTAVLKTDSGTVIIDSMSFPMQGALIRRKAKELTGSEVTLVINTHYHLDHTHGNPAFIPGTKVVATKRTLSHLKALDSAFWEGDSAILLPNETFDDQLKIEIGNKVLTLLSPGRGHTDGDLVVLIENEETVIMGDLFFNKHYPNIDLEAGGSVQEWPMTLDKVLSLNFNKAVPGHGDTSDRLGIQNFQRFMDQLAVIGLAAVADESSLEDTLKSTRFTADSDYEPLKVAGMSLGLDREFVIRRAWQEATGNFERKN